MVPIPAMCYQDSLSNRMSGAYRASEECHFVGLRGFHGLPQWSVTTRVSTITDPAAPKDSARGTHPPGPPTRPAVRITHGEPRRRSPLVDSDDWYTMVVIMLC